MTSLIRMTPAAGTAIETARGLDLYLDRIGYAGRPAPDFATLDAIVRAHIARIPFEALDVQLGVRVSSDLPAIFDKLVVRRRGGWCYEQNGLLGWALGAIGFDVMRVAGGVMRVSAGDEVIGNHLALIVSLDEPWLVDVGFGGSLSGPIPLRECWLEQPPYEISLKLLDDGFWRFEEWIAGSPFSWDFRTEPADERRFAYHLERLQTEADSHFVQTLIAQRRIDDTHLALRGRVLRRAGPSGQEQQLLCSGTEIAAVLADAFGLDVPAIASVWPKVAERHRVLFGD